MLCQGTSWKFFYQHLESNVYCKVCYLADFFYQDANDFKAIENLRAVSIEICEQAKHCLKGHDRSIILSSSSHLTGRRILQVDIEEEVVEQFNKQ
jgi:hypothetical protein